MADIIVSDLHHVAATVGGSSAGTRVRAVTPGRRPSPHTADQRRAERARMTVILCGIPERVVRRAEGQGPIDWSPLAGEVDGLSIATGGQHGVRAFWRTPHSELTGRTPVEALDSPAAVRLVAHLVREHATAVRRARFGFSV